MQHNAHLCRHVHPELAIRVGYIKRGIIKHGIIDFFRGGQNDPQLAVKSLIGSSQNREIDRHARFDSQGIGFGHLGLHRHAGQIGQFENDRHLLCSIHGLALFGDDVHHHPIHRRKDFGVAKVGTLLVDFELLLTNLRLQGNHIGLILTIAGLRGQ